MTPATRRRNRLIVLLVIVFSGCRVSPSSRMPSGPYFGLQATSTPQLLLPEFISTQLDELNGTFSPGGKEYYYTSGDGNTIVFTRMQPDGRWSAPEIASFSGDYPEFDPLFAPDGDRLYFSSHRPVAGADGVASKSDIWFVERDGDSWSSPRHAGIPVDAERGNYYSSVSRSGDIYFNSRGDIYKAVQRPSGYDVERLGEAVNSEHTDVDPFISPDEDYLIFRSYRPGGFGSGDLYISFRVDGEWTQAENLGATFNSVSSDYCPWVSEEAGLFIFSSSRTEETYQSASIRTFADLLRKFESVDNGRGNIYVSSDDFIETLRRRWLPARED